MQSSLELLRSRATFPAKPEKFDVVISDEEAVFPIHDLLGLAHEVEFFFFEIPIVLNLAALRTDQVMVMVRLIALGIFITDLPVPAVDPAQQAGLFQEFERAVYRRNPDIALRRLEQGIDLLGTQVLLALDQDVEDLRARGGPAREVWAEKGVMRLDLSGHGAIVSAGAAPFLSRHKAAGNRKSA
jgi:hypothetical protein